LVDSLIDALGLDTKRLKAFTLHCRVDELVIVECERYVEGNEKKIVKEKFKLVKI
jgi:hypothetical protein